MCKKKILFIIFFFSFISLFSQNKKPIIDYVFLLDTSTSMEGKPEGLGYVDIFDDVKKEINNFIADIEPPANVFIYKFNAGVQSSRMFEINTIHDLNSVQNYILNTEATGNTTYIYRSLEDILQKMNNFIESHPKEKHSVILQLFTDGNDKDKPPYNMERVMNYFQQIKKEDNWWIFYTTLGVELPTKDKKIIDNYPEVKYIHNEKGVHPIQIIKNKIQKLNFGNLWENPASTQTALFKLPIKKKLPANISISVNEEFLNFPDGLGVIVNPDNFIPQKRVDFNIEIIGFNKNKKECEGLYKFNIKLISQDPFVQIVPDVITAKFLFEPPRTVEIVPSRNEEFPINFGELNIYKKTEVTVEKKINLLYNNQALVKGGNITVNWEAEKSPTELTSDNFFLNNSREEYLTVSPKNKEIVIKIRADKDLKSGKYNGKINFVSEDIAISGKELIKSKDNPNVKCIKWSFEIPKKPTPFYVWPIILIFLGIIFYIVYKILTKPPVFKDLTLQVLGSEPEDIDLKGKTVATFGVNGKNLTYAKEAFKIIARKDGNRINAVVDVIDGTVKLQRSDDNSTNVIFGEENVYNGDIIILDNLRIEISSFKISRD